MLLVDDEVYFSPRRPATSARAMAAFGHEEPEAAASSSSAAAISASISPRDRNRQASRHQLEADRGWAGAGAARRRRVLAHHGRRPGRRAGSRDPGRGQRRAADTVIAVTNDDEVNILSSLLAKRLRLPARHHPDQQARLPAAGRYALGIDVVVSPRPSPSRPSCSMSAAVASAPRTRFATAPANFSKPRRSTPPPSPASGSKR